MIKHKRIFGIVLLGAVAALTATVGLTSAGSLGLASLVGNWQPIGIAFQNTTSGDTEIIPLDAIVTLLTPSATPATGPGVPVPSPTPQSAPSPTPAYPTFTPQPPVNPSACTLIAPRGDWVNVRALPSVYADDIGDFSDSAATVPIARYDSSYTWYKVWWVPTAQYAWIAQVSRLTVKGDCTTLPVIADPFEHTPESDTVLAGFHVLMGQGNGAVLNHAAQIDVLKCLDGAYGLCDEFKRLNPDGVTICRTLNTNYGMIDCPAPWMYEDPAIWQDGIRFHAGCDYYEIQNECPPPPGGFAEWAAWSIHMADFVQRETGGAMLAFSFSPGTPDLDAWPELLPYLNWVEQHPLPDGRHHGVATHSSAYVTFDPPPDATWLNDPYVAGREVLACDLLSQSGFDCRAWPGAWFHTEIGLHDGYSGTWRNEWTCDELADAYRTTRQFIRDQDIVSGFTWWNVGQISIWASVHECLPQMVS